MFKDEKDEKRKLCEGCLTGNYFLCDSFPGKPKDHAKREIEYRKKKSRRIDRLPRTAQVFRREDEVE